MYSFIFASRIAQILYHHRTGHIGDRAMLKTRTVNKKILRLTVYNAL